jgi:carbon storage regulator
MLVLTRREREVIHIGPDVTISVVRVSGDKVRIGIEAPDSVKIFRGEVLEREKQKEEAMKVSSGEVKLASAMACVLAFSMWCGAVLGQSPMPAERMTQAPVSYEQAFADCDAGLRPMVVYIGAEWCAACVRSRSAVIDPALRAGDFAGCNVVFLTLAQGNPQSVEEHNAKRLLDYAGENKIPQLIVCSRTLQGWTRDVAKYPMDRMAIKRLADRARALMGK